MLWPNLSKRNSSLQVDTVNKCVCVIEREMEESRMTSSRKDRVAID